METYGITDHEQKWFTDYLFNRKQIVDVDAHLSDPYYVKNGVPQGSILGPLLFILFFGDVVDHLKSTDIIKYADDTVIYFAHSDLKIIVSNLQQDLDSLSKYFNENELIINLSKGKTETMLFGTSKRISNTPGKLSVTYMNTPVYQTSSYKYLGCKLDTHLTMNDFFDGKYKAACSKLKLLSQISLYLTKKATLRVYQAMILPALTYNSLTTLNLSQTRQQKLISFQRRAHQVTKCAITPIENLMKKNCCLIVRKCLENLCCDAFNIYFDINSHSKNTRNNNHMVKLPRVKLEVAKASFYFMGAKLYNELPPDIRKAENFTIFKKLVNEYFN